MHVSRRIASALAATALLASACSFGPPPSCGDNIGGTADTVVFDQYFNSMALVSHATGQTGPEGDSGSQFAQGDQLEIQIDAKSAVDVRACIQPTSGGNKIAFDQTQSMSQGPNVFPVGAFDKGTYVIRVIVGDTLVKNFPFATE
ncbi:MAG TPA: hypothetical protein VLD63_02860 [Anaerolineales bacterium]|nr:hypothetical protein [Anaerolineales bacterium]